MNNRGQFSIIAALLVAIILAGTLIAVYATIRYDSSQSQTPQTLTATDETNAALLKALGFTVGYYGSILQVTGNQTYAYDNATIYMNSALQYIANMNPSLGESINMTGLSLRTNWFSNPSISTGTLSVVYDLADLGIYGVNYTTSCSLGVQIFNSPNNNQVCVNVTQDLTEPLTSLGQQNFAFYSYNYSTSNWQLINPSLSPTIFANGTYLINVPSGIKSSAYMVQVTDSRGIMVEASSFNSYNLNFAFSPQSSSAPAVVELLQNGTMLWSGQGLQNVTQTQPIPLVPVKALHLCQTGSTSDIPFQVEDWASGYQIPLGLTSNYTIFSNNQMVVFEVNPSMSQLTLWWNGSDTAIQPSAAYKDTCFTADNPSSGTLSNGNMTLQFSYPSSHFQIESIVGNVNSTANFMRIDADPSVYGSGSPAYVVQYGVVRDIVQEEAEWNNGPTNCPNVYSQIVFTLPANATYYTYQLRLIFINSAANRTISDISPLQLTTPISQPQAMTENGILNGIPNVTNGTGIFNNSTGSVHHWSQLVNSGQQGTGIMFTDSANQQLYAFDSMANTFTGALYVNTSTPVIELDPVTSAGPVSFTSPLDLTWYGEIATFNGANTIYASNGNSGLWSLVEQPPSVAITPESSSAASISISPSADPVGTTVTVSGGGFLPGSQITITYNGNIVAATTATAYGAIPSGAIFDIPTSSLGSNTISAYDTSSNSASANFNVTLYPMETITFQPSRINNDVGSATILTIDSVPYNYSMLPTSFTWEAGSTHTISASNIISVGSNKQYQWESWSNGGAQTQNYVVPASSATVTATYDPQYQVTFNYQASGGDSGYSAPNVTYYNSGSPLSITSSPSATVWVDSGSTYTYTNNPLIGSNSSERWFTPSPSGPVSCSTTISPTYYNQYSVTFGYGDQDSGAVTSGSQIGFYYQFGSTETITAGSSYGVASPSSDWVDAGSAVSYRSFASGSQRWVLSSSPASFTVSSSTTISDLSYYHQYQITPYYTLSDSSSATVTNVVGFTQFGSGSTVTPTKGSSGGTAFWADAGSAVTYNSPINGASGERWQVASADNGVYSAISSVSSSTTATVEYYHQYSFQLDYAISGSGSGYSAPTLTTTQFGSIYTPTLTTNLVTYWLDKGQSWSITNPLTGSGSSQRWQTSQTITGTVGSSSPTSAGGSLTFTYYNQYSITFQYSVLDGGSYSAPTVTYYQFGTSGHAVTAVTSGGTAIWVDAGTTYSYTNPLTKSNSQQASTNSATGTSSVSGIVINTYYNQYKFTLSYSVNDGSSGYSAPTLTATEYGSAYVTSLTGTATGYWLDAGQSWSVTNPLSGSTSSEQWDTSKTSSGTVSVAQTTVFTYYDQYSFTLSYSISGSGTGYSAPTLTSTQFGSSYKPALGTSGTQYWLDAGQSWSVTNPLTGSGSSQRWQTSQTISGTVGSSSPTSAGSSLTFTYYNQYKVTLSYSVSGGGSGYSAPAFTATQYSASAPQILTTTASGYWFDAAASWSITNPLSGSSGTERWYTSQATTGTVSSTTIAFVYNNQYQVTFDASSNVKSDSSATIVTVAGTGYNYAQLPYTNWFNAASLTYSYASPIGSSSSSTTGYYWSSTGGLSQTLQSNTFTVSGSDTITATYTAQTFGIDTNCEGFGSVSGGKTITTTSMTAQANELVIIVITGNSSSPAVSSVTDNFGTHLTYHQQVAYSGGGAGQCLYVYYAVTGSQTGSFKVTVTMSINYTYCVQAFGITGANTATPFDTNSNLPAKAAGTSLSLPTVTGVSTSNAHDMILAFEGQTNSTTQTSGSSFTAPAGLLNNVNSLGNNVEYQIVSATQSSISVSFGTSVTPWIMTVEGVQRAW
ncbi:MAG: hypothetical protein ABSA75_04975 [Candidatus Bathyarchaeia archaeon]